MQPSLLQRCLEYKKQVKHKKRCWYWLMVFLFLSAIHTHFNTEHFLPPVRNMHNSIVCAYEVICWIECDINCEIFFMWSCNGHHCFWFNPSPLLSSLLYPMLFKRMEIQNSVCNGQCCYFWFYISSFSSSCFLTPSLVWHLCELVKHKKKKKFI